MAAHSKPVAVLFDALGTLLTFEPPAPHLRAALRERTGADIGEQGAKDAIRAEIAYYRAHLHEGRDPESLLDLRIRCAEAMELPFSTPVVLDALLASLRFHAYDDSAPALRALRAAGIRTAVVSNWDWSLHERLQETGLAGLVDGALASAEVGSAKPDGGHLPRRAGARRRGPGGDLARGRHAGGRRRGCPRGRHPPRPDRARGRRRRRRPNAGRAHTLGAALMTSPEPAHMPPRAEVPVWVPFLALAAVLFIVSVFGLGVYAAMTDHDPSLDGADDLAVGATQALTFIQDFVVRLRRLAGGQALGRRDVARSAFGLVRPTAV